VQRLIKKLGVSGSAKQAAASAQLVATMREQVVEPNARESAEGSETQGDLADKPREKKTLGREWSKRWLTPMAIATVLLAAAVIVTLVSWSPGLLSGRKVEVTTKEVDSARQAAEAKLADADKARQAAEAKAADAQKALQAAQAQASDAEKARQAAEAKDADAEKARQAAQTQAADAEKARQAAEAKPYLHASLRVLCCPADLTYYVDLFFGMPVSRFVRHRSLLCPARGALSL
jgi:hypothetical protein